MRKELLSKILRRYPFLSGCGTVANSKWVRSLAGDSKQEVWAKLENGLSVKCSLAEFGGRAVFYAGDTDRKLTKLLQIFLRPGDTVLDIGANIGTTVLRSAHLVGPHGHVHAFEPNPAVQKTLKESVAFNGLENVTIHSVAVGDSPGELDLMVPIGHNGGASLTRRDVEATQATGTTMVKVPVRTVDDIFSTPAFEAIRLVKIDVEGFEPQVIQGAYNLFRQVPPDVMVVEVNLCENLDQHPTVLALRDLGYQLFCIEKSYLNLKITKLEAGRTSFPGHDILALRPGKVSPHILDQLSISAGSAFA
ncbi:MAG: FkbM family methyltransferase [Cyanobacteria bacterium J06614_10]